MSAINFKYPERYRIIRGPFTSKSGSPGAFLVPLKKELGNLLCVASDKRGWEHVSVSVKLRKKNKKPRCPTWAEMCMVKDLFWSKGSVVIQYHPKEEDYINLHKYTLHLWRPISVELPTPDPILVGFNLKSFFDEKGINKD